MKAGLAGFVIDGCIRDIDEISTFENFPVYAKGVTPNGPYKNGPGEINVPVSVCGQVICPGDILVGDQDGLLVIKTGRSCPSCRKKPKQYLIWRPRRKQTLRAEKVSPSPGWTPN